MDTPQGYEVCTSDCAHPIWGPTFHPKPSDLTVTVLSGKHQGCSGEAIGVVSRPALDRIIGMAREMGIFWKVSIVLYDGTTIRADAADLRPVEITR